MDRQARSLYIIGNTFIRMVLDNVRKRKDIYGEAFEPYSYDYFSYKYGNRIAPRTKRKLTRDQALDHEYKRVSKIRAVFETQKYNVDMVLTGAMLSDIQVLEAGMQSKYRARVVIGASSRKNAEKIYFHNTAGVGINRITRRFFGLSNGDEKEMRDLIHKVFTGSEFVLKWIKNDIDKYFPPIEAETNIKDK